MFDMEKALKKWRSEFRKCGSLEDGILVELESHLRDETERLKKQGLPESDAFAAAAAAVGKPAAVGDEYRKNNARSLWDSALFLHSLKVALRKMRRQKWYSAISVAGLAAGMACAILVLLWVRQERSFDRFHARADSLVRVIVEEKQDGGTSVHPWLPFPLGPSLARTFPEIEAVSRWRPDNMVVRTKDISHTETRFLTVDPGFFSMFSFPFLSGTPERAFSDPHSIVIRDSVAEKYFGREDPLGKVLNLSGRADLVVTGVVHIPEASDFQFDFFFPFQAYPLFNVNLASYEADWESNNYQVYLLLKDGVSAEALQAKISGFLKEHLPEGRNPVLRLQPLASLHLYLPDGSDGASLFVKIFSLVAGFVLLIACANFVNLSTARSEKRAKEVGLRKTMGGTRGQLARHFVGEAMLHSALAAAFALVLVKLALPFFILVTGRRLNLDLLQIDLLAWIGGLLVLTGLIAGFYPALVLSSVAPARAVKPIAQPRGRRFILRKFLVVFQFSLSTFLIIGTLIVNAQVRFIAGRDLGMKEDHVVYHLMQKTTRDSVKTAREDILRHPGIESLAAASHLPSQIVSWIGNLDWAGRPAGKEPLCGFLSVDPGFVDTLGLTVIRGRNFSWDRPADMESFLVNETAVRQLDLAEPVGTELRFWGHKGPIIGVVKDFTNRHIAKETAPLIMAAGSWGSNKSYLFLRLKGSDPTGALRHFQDVWKKYSPGFPTEYRFLDETIDEMYMAEKRLLKIILMFAGLAVLISCLGLVGLSSFMAEEKTKEIGIRKVLGASPRRIVALFSGNFLVLVGIANLIAWPAGFFVMQAWLRDYAFRIPLGIGVFVLAGSAGLLVALLSVGIQTLRAALADPVQSLRYE